MNLSKRLVELIEKDIIRYKGKHYFLTEDFGCILARNMNRYEKTEEAVIISLLNKFKDLEEGTLCEYYGAILALIPRDIDEKVRRLKSVG